MYSRQFFRASELPTTLYGHTLQSQVPITASFMESLLHVIPKFKHADLEISRCTNSKQPWES